MGGGAAPRSGWLSPSVAQGADPRSCRQPAVTAPDRSAEKSSVCGSLAQMSYKQCRVRREAF